jgi:hypothetical protein
MKRAYLSVKADHILAEYGEPHKKPVARVKLRSGEDWGKFLQKYRFSYALYSSSLDFPEEHTDDQRIIDLCAVVRLTSGRRRLTSAK